MPKYPIGVPLLLKVIYPPLAFVELNIAFTALDIVDVSTPVPTAPLKSALAAAIELENVAAPVDAKVRPAVEPPLTLR